jgi:type III secretory pathway component EscV
MKIVDIVMKGDLVTVLRRYADIMLAFLVMMVVGMMIIPVPPFLLDLLLVLNMSISIRG